MAVGAPTGLVTFLFTDVEGSTSTWAADPAGMSASLVVHDDLLREVIDEHQGYVFTTAGDAFCVAFQSVSQAVAAAETAQERLALAEWPGPPLRVRMGLHVGEAEERAGDYFGPTVNLAARVEAAAHGGQVIVTEAVRIAAALEVTDLGEHRLKDIPDLVRLHQLGKGEFPSPRTTGGRSNLPIAVTRLEGREDDIRDVRIMVRQHRLVTLTGTGGAGKTRLAIAVGEDELPSWPDGVWFADLTSAADRDDVVRSAIEALGLGAGTDPMDQIVERLTERRLLLVLDNCEHVIDAAAELAERVLGRRGRGHLLATSREWLDIDGEHVVPVAPLAVGDRDSPAVRLFLDRARAVAPDSDVADIDAIQQLCERLDGLPLAIELAAARSAVATPTQLLEGLDDRFRLLSSGRRRERGRTLETTIHWSYRLLDDEARRALRALGAFRSGFDLDGAAAVTGLQRAEARDVVEALIVRSLVTWIGEGRFRLLESIKAFAEARLDEEGELDLVRGRHADHLLRRFEPIDMFLLRGFVHAEELLPDRHEALVAIDHLFDAGRWDDGGLLLVRVSPLFWYIAAPCLARIERCRDLAGDALCDELRMAELSLAAGSTDWERAFGIISSFMALDDPETAAWGGLQLAIGLARTDPERTAAAIDAYEAVAGGRCEHRHGDDHEWARLVLACSRYDLASVRHQLDVVATTPDPLSTIEGPRLAVAAVLAAIDGRSDDVDRYTRETIELVSWMDNGPFRQMRVLADPDDLDALRDLGVHAASGRFRLVENDALILLAAERLRSGDVDRAAGLLRSTAPCRSPAMTLLGRHVAKQTGVDEEVESAIAEHTRRATARGTIDVEWATERPRRALREELERRGWLDPGR
ncbi:MAG: adenylate/guanylate cyclase domain-containing protein [Actinomycetota bacterium]